MIYAAGGLHGNPLRFQSQYFPEQAYDKYKKQQDLRLSPVEQSFLDSVEQLERLEDQAH